MGSIIHRPERLSPFTAVVITGWTTDGRPIRRSRSASSEKEARRLLAGMVRARDVGDPIPNERQTVARYLATWLGRQQPPRVRATTAKTYRFQIERLIAPRIGSIPLPKLRPSEVETMLDDLAHLSPHTVAGARSVLRTALADAERDRLVTFNAAALARGHRGAIRRHPAPSVASISAVLDGLADHRLGALYVLAAMSGLRLGEISGLRWSDLDGSTLHVRVQLQQTRDPAEPFVLVPPKSESSRRDIRLPASAIEALRVHRIRQAEERLAAGSGWQNASDLVFTTAQGGPLHPNTVRWILAQAIKAAGVPPFPFHSFRRFAATVVGGSGDMAAAQALLGHRSQALTADVYVTKTDAAMQRAADVMERAVGR